MRSRRSFLINNGLSHGLCNYDCGLCSVNDPSYDGPRELQSAEVTEALLGRVREAAEEGVWVRHVGYSGHGEPTLHPEFTDRVDMLGELVRSWRSVNPPPVVGVVTNGSRLLENGILDAFSRNPVGLTLSLPTVDPQAYGKVMVKDPAQGPELLARVLEALDHAFELQARGHLAWLLFHISPPDPEVIRPHLPATLDALTRRAAARGVREIRVTLFITVANRSGKIRGGSNRADSFRDLRKRFHGQLLNGVLVKLEMSLDVMYPSMTHLADMLWAFDYPCLWNGNFVITANGSSVCCNDQSRRHPMGNVLTHSLREMIEEKEAFAGSPSLCGGCNQKPHQLTGSALARLYATASSVRMRWRRFRLD
ncbi:MAG: radical SAM protein [Deltaproteobacteria bacterium]|nr:radical SAM protein [Deltaproteobacteria bacterium]